MNPSTKVYKNIEQKILERKWLPGTKIMSENQLSKELNVSRVSVREAIEKLVVLGVLTKKQGEGTFVNELDSSIYLNGLLPMILLDQDGLVDIIEFRKIFEEGSVGLFARRCTDEDIKKLEKYYDEMKINIDNPEAFYKADFNFHRIIAEGTYNTLVIKVNKILTDLLMYHQKEIHYRLGPQGGIKEHKGLLEAFKERDAELATLLMKRHLNRTLSELKKSSKDDNDINS